MQIDPIEESTTGYSFATTNSGVPVGSQLPIPVLIQTVAERDDSSSSISTASAGTCTEGVGEKLIMDRSVARSLVQHNLLFIKQRLRRGVEEVVQKESQKIHQKFGHLKQRLQRANQNLKRIVSNAKGVEKQPAFLPWDVDQERLDSYQQNADRRLQRTKQRPKRAMKEGMHFDSREFSEEHDQSEIKSASIATVPVSCLASQVAMEMKHVDDLPMPPNSSDDPYIQEINNDEEYLKTFTETMEQL